MKIICTTTIIFILLLFSNLAVFAQHPVWNDPNSLPQWMTAEEELRLDEIGKGHTLTPPPLGTIRNVAEFDRAEAVLIRWPLGISSALVAAMSQHVKVLTIVSNQSTQNSAISSYQSAGAKMANCEFMIAASDSYWTRDYGPMYINEGNNKVSIVNFNYNRPRPNDNAIPGKVAQYYNIPWYSMNLTTAGGNYMSDGTGIAASTELIYEENGNNPAAVNQLVLDYLGIHTYHVTIDPPGDYIKHIDCWGKFLDVDKILIAQVAPTHARYWAYEQVAGYFASQISAYGTPFQVFRVYTPNLQPYTNSLILNNKVYVPIVSSTFDAQAIQAYKDAMPGYEVLGFTGSWQSTDALHCRTRELADRGILYIRHIPLSGLKPYRPFFQIMADIIPYSGQALKPDSLFVYYKTNQGAYSTVPMSFVRDNIYAGNIPVAPGDTLISYYLFAADQSGRREFWPLIGAPGARSFRVTVPANVAVTPDSLIFNTPAQAANGLFFNVSNPFSQNIVIDTIKMRGKYYLVDEAANIQFPLLLPAGASRTFKVIIPFGLPVIPGTGYVRDTVFVKNGWFAHRVKLAINTSLITSLPEPEKTIQVMAVWPNPMTAELNISFSLEKNQYIKVELYDLFGRKTATVLNDFRPAGAHSMRWKVDNNLPNGLYLLKIIARNEAITKRIIVAR